MGHKILIVCSSRAREGGHYINEQVNDLRDAGCDVHLFYMRGRGLTGYLRSYLPLINVIKSIKPDIVHAHYGLSGLVAALLPFRKVILTVHGGDIYTWPNRVMTMMASRLSAHVIAVSNDIAQMLKKHRRVTVIPCAVNVKLFEPASRASAREKLGMNHDDPLILFSSRFDNKSKNSALALKAVSLAGREGSLKELRDRSRTEIALLLNAADMLLLTSNYEGSPQIVKEAMACNIPIVSTDVGDVSKNISGLKGCYICSNDPAAIAESINKAFLFRREGQATGGRERLMELGLMPEAVTKKILEVYGNL